MNIAKQSEERLENIDALRGIAVILVVWMHSSEFFANLSTGVGRTAWPYSFARLIDFGRIGVALFFAISGFVILSTLKNRSNGWFRSFALKRFFRLYPLYWFSIPISLYINFVFNSPSPSWGAILMNFSMLQEYFGFESVQGIYWTLHVEIVFYSLSAFLFLLTISDKYKAVAFCLAFCLLGFLLTRVAIYFFHFQSRSIVHGIGMLGLHLSIMFWGSLVRLKFENKINFRYSVIFVYGYLILFLALLFITIVLASLSKLSFDSDFFRLGVAYPVAITLFYFGVNYNVFKNDVLSYVGRISYSIYLFHNSIICIIFLIFYYFEFVFNTNLVLIAMIALSLLAATVISGFSYQFIEKPSIKFGLMLAKR